MKRKEIKKKNELPNLKIIRMFFKIDDWDVRNGAPVLSCLSLATFLDNWTASDLQFIQWNCTQEVRQ